MDHSRDIILIADAPEIRVPVRLLFYRLEVPDLATVSELLQVIVEHPEILVGVLLELVVLLAQVLHDLFVVLLDLGDVALDQVHLLVGFLEEVLTCYVLLQHLVFFL